MLSCKWFLLGTVAIFCEKGNELLWPMIEGEWVRIISGSCVNVCSAKGTLFHQAGWTEGQDHMAVTI
jgi:hypothetical protein